MFLVSALVRADWCAGVRERTNKETRDVRWCVGEGR